MKKIILSMAAVAAMTLVACNGNSDKAADSAKDSNQVEATTEATENAEATDAAGASLLQKVKESATAENVQTVIDKVKQLISEGKAVEAKNLLEQIKPYAEKVGLTKAVTTVETALDKANDAAQAMGAVNEAKGQVEAAKQQATDAVNNAKQQAEAAKQQANAAASALKGLGK
ncbi:MAG: hypothetical protein U0M50_07000 [Paramuribaculum sp.]